MNTSKLKLMDALLVWGICFLLFGTVGSLLAGVIGIWSFCLCQIASAVTVFVLAGRTGLSAGKLLTPGGQSPRESAGGALIWVACLLAAIPFFLFSHLLVPGFATTTFHIYDYTDSTAAAIVSILLAGICESLLFDGFLFVRLKGISKAHPLLPYLLLGILGGVYHGDLYLLLPMALLSVGIAYVRSRTGGFVLPMILRTLTVLVMTAYAQVSDAGEQLMGDSMGIVQVIGFGLIFFGAALPAAVCGARALGDLKDRSFFEKCMVIAVSVVLIASGCGISTF